MGFVSRCLLAMALVLGALLVSPRPLRADQPVSITGLVVDYITGTPLSGAVVSAGTYPRWPMLQTKTDRNGRFALIADSAAINYISAEYPGFEPWITRFQLAPGTSAQVRLKLDNMGHYRWPERSELTETETYDRYVIR